MAEVLSLEPVTKKAFASFGDVIETQGSPSFDINHGTTTRFHDLARVQLLGDNPRPLVSIARCQEFHLPIEVNMLERHPLGSQAFIPLVNHSFLVVVAEDNNGIPQNLRAYKFNGNQGVNYHANTWHFTLIAFDGIADFLIVDRGGEGNNLEEYFFDKPYLVR